jgi:hypothetical protein
VHVLMSERDADMLKWELAGRLRGWRSCTSIVRYMSSCCSSTPHFLSCLEVVSSLGRMVWTRPVLKPSRICSIACDIEITVAILMFWTNEQYFWGVLYGDTFNC